jgi:transcriptional regulator GlxA family with amidase domain
MSPKTPQIPPQAPRQVETASRRIEVLAFPDVQMLDVAGPIQVFTAANERATSPSGRLPYETRVIAPNGAEIRATSGLAFATNPLPDPADPLDTLIVAGGGGVMRAAEDASLVEWLKVRAGAARRTASVCTGAFLLAAAGLLDRRRAVTHWEYCDELSRRYPAVTVEPDPIFVHDDPVWTSAGVTSGIDLSLALVEEDLGRALAVSVARHLCSSSGRAGRRSSAPRFRCNRRTSVSRTCTFGSPSTSPKTCRSPALPRSRA